MLTDLEVRKAAPGDKPFRLADSAGLSLLVLPNGAKRWLLRYRFPQGGTQRELGLGVYPQVPLASKKGPNDEWIEGARDLRDVARRQLARGDDPMALRRQENRTRRDEHSSTLSGLWDEWLKHKVAGGHWSLATQDKATYYMRREVLPSFVNRPLSSISRVELAELIQRLEGRAPEAADKISGWLCDMFRFALALGRVDENVADALRAIRSRRTRPKAYAHLPFSELPTLLSKIDEYGGSRGVLTRIAARLMLLTALRPGEIRKGRWSEIDLDAGIWTIPADKMKMRRQHSVPLPRQAIELLKELRTMRRGDGELMFPGRDRASNPMSENSVNSMMRRLGFAGKQTGHGFRHLISSQLNERGYNKDEIEVQLSHGDSDEIRGTYNHADYLERRRVLMQDWANLIDEIETASA